MTVSTQLAVTPRERFLEAAQMELIAFEQREREFSKKERQERAAGLQFPALKNELSQLVGGPDRESSDAAHGRGRPSRLQR
jgi:hypothetical protein